MNDEEEIAGLREVHSVMQDSAEVMAALIGIIRGGETASDNLLAVANNSLIELSAWSAKLRELSKEVSDDDDAHEALH